MSTLVLTLKDLIVYQTPNEMCICDQTVAVGMGEFGLRRICTGNNNNKNICANTSLIKFNYLSSKIYNCIILPIKYSFK